jgi:LytS/YehU family sensor histidine kinase
MTSFKLDKMRVAPMWWIYAGAWLGYTVLIACALQSKNLSQGRFNLEEALHAGSAMIVPALVLSLVWPLTGYLERRGWRAPLVSMIHMTGALLFSVFSQLVLAILIAPQVMPVLWYTWPFLFSLMMYAVIAAIFHSIRANHAVQRQMLAMHQAQSLLIASELNALRSKLNPHFLFNTLHSIIALTRKDSAAAETALFQFSDMLRYVLDTEKSGNDRVTLDDELRFVRDYLDLEALRLGARLTVKWDIDDAAGGHTLPALSLQPIVENSIKHAFNPHSRPGILLIQTRLDAGNRLSMTVRDAGPGADLARVRESSGLGIRTVERRLLLEYGPRASFHIDTAPGAGFTVSMSIPLAHA